VPKNTPSHGVGFVEASVERVRIVVFLAFGIILGRLFYLQILNYPHYRAQSDANSLRLIIEPAPRGLITDRKGVVLATSVPTYSLFLVPADVQTHGPTLQNLSRLLEEPLPVLEELVSSRKYRRKYEPIRLRTHLTQDLIDRVEEHLPDLPGVYIQMEPERFYPFGEKAAHILGTIGEINEEELFRLRMEGYGSGDWIGKRGVERIYDRYLRGEPGGFQVEVDPAGIQRRTVSYRSPNPGKTLRLSIDFEVQKLAEDLLGDMAGAVVAVDPKNGELLALASRPGFDPNQFVSGISVQNWNKLLNDPLKPLQNRVVQGQYPPGSVFKIVTALSALDSGEIDPEKTLLCHGIYWYKTWPYRCWKHFGHGWVSMQKALVESCDVYFYQLGLQIKVDKLYRAARAFGLGSKTRIDLDGETAGLVPNARWKEATQHMPWFPGNTIQMSIGQGYLLTTPLQVLNLTCAMANRGVVIQPHLLYQILDEKTGQARMEYRETELLRIPYQPKDIDLVRQSLELVVGSASGTGKKSRVSGIDVAGKTGTSENPHGENHAWFTAFAPVDKPEVAVIVLVENGGEGGLVAAPIAKRVIEASLGREVTPWGTPVPTPDEDASETPVASASTPVIPAASAPTSTGVRPPTEVQP
jgi:penicillin-binding protein 2